MVALSNSYSEDVLRMATAFRSARDEDNRQVLNAMAAKKTPSSLNDLTFYMVPSIWMMKAWPMLDAVASSNGNAGADDDGKWRESVGPIQTSELLSCDHTVSDEEGGSGNSKPTNGSSSQQQQSTNSFSLKRDLKHGVDFFLLGPSAWMLVKNKFGFDNEIGKPCVFHQTGESVLAVAIDSPPQNGGNTSSAGHQNLVPIPPGGYFPYEKLLEELEGDSEESFLPQPSSRQQAPQQQAQAHVGTTQTTVSDDEGGENDLFPDHDPDAMVVSSESDSRTGNTAQHESQGPIILLPPSTTSSPADSNNNDSLYPNVQDMECGDNTESKDDPTDQDDTVATARVVSAAPASTYKRYGSGLGNLGNTCFMNSTLQCLAHTDPLRRYFLSGEYEKDLNRDNPLGTGGDLATEFARLLAEMWGTALPGARKVESSSYVSSSSVVYPRSFKYTLGKHAEQFMGYDQHDSQELATYLLDALHEDTNRVTKKPYVEKPEQGEDEADDVAAKKAWDLHLKREDSRVLENFMGQVKSRVHCCKDGCGRVSTTFDPFMYLSVPIPGATDRTMRVTFVPLDGQIRRKDLSVTLNRNSSVGRLVTKTAQQLMKAGYSSNGKPFSLDELCACDIWTKEVYNWYEMEDEIDKIRETDETYIYQVQAKAELRKLEEDGSAAEAANEESRIAEALENSPYRPMRYKVDPATMRSLHDEGWKNSLEGYTRMQPLQLTRVLNPRRGSTAERFDLYQKLDGFIVSCIKESDKASNKRAREEEDDEDSPPSPQEQTISADSECIMVKPDEEEVPALIERSEKSDTFKAVKSRFDLAVLEHCATKLKRMIHETLGKSKKKKEDGFYVQVYQRKSPSSGLGSTFNSEKSFVNPLVLRMPATTTVYGLREELAKRLVRCLRLPNSVESEGQPTNEDTNVSSESDVIPMEGDSDRGEDDQLSGVDSMNVSSDSQHNNMGDPALLIMRQIPLSYYRKKPHSYGQSKAMKKLGSLETEQSSDGSRPISLASPTHADEQELVFEWVGDKGTVYLEWPAELCDQSFDDAEFETSDEVKDPEEVEALAARNRKANHPITILDCVEKYCAEEQLEETEMWYCNRCKEHVRAWKQFHIYLAPPILIMHLKRFQYSASTHRRDKIGTFIDFPLTGLDLSKHVLHYVDGEKPIYDCYAVSNHYGGLGGGHYTAYALNDDGVWCHYDDSRVTDGVDPKTVVSEAAYVVYYRRRDVVVNDNFLEGLETPAIITDHVDKVQTLSDASSTNAAADMDVDDLHAGDADSRGSSRTCSSPMDSHDGDGGDGHIGEYGGDDFYGPQHENHNSYPAQ